MEFRKMVTITHYARQQKKYRCIGQSAGLCGRGRGWDDSGEWQWGHKELHRTEQLNWTEEEDQYSKEVEMKQELELTLRALEMELKTVRNDLNQVEQSLVKFSNFWHYVNIMYSIPLI